MKENEPELDGIVNQQTLEKIGIEFTSLYDGDVCDNFVKKWCTYYRPRIIALAKQDFPAVMLLQTLNNLVEMAETDVEGAVQGKGSIYKQYQQPCWFRLGKEKKPSQFFLVLDEILISASSTTVESFDMLFKSHFAFKVEYFTLSWQHLSTRYCHHLRYQLVLDHLQQT